MRSIFYEDSFDSAHWLPNVPADHKCASLHGHTYRIRIEVQGEVGDTSGWIIDYADLKAAWLLIKSDLDHKCLNGVPGLDNPTCEILVDYIAERLHGTLAVSKIELRETANCGVVYRA